MDYSELRRYLELASRWERPKRHFPLGIVSDLRRTPVLHFIRGWEQKDKRYLLKKIREIRDKYAPWLEILEDEGARCLEELDKLRCRVSQDKGMGRPTTTPQGAQQRDEVVKRERRSVARFCSEVPKVDVEVLEGELVS